MTADHLQKLGTSRETIEEKRTYLTELAQQLYVLTSQTLRGRYHGLHDESLKLRRFVREAHDAFTSEMINHGHSVPFHIIPIGAHPTKGIDRKAAATGPSVSFPSGDGGLFGKAGFGGFGSQGAIHVGPHAPSTKGHPLEAPAIAEGNTGTEHYLQTICSMQPFKNFSMEELRLSDHLQAQPSSANPSSGGSLFKNTSRTQPSGFGSTPSKGDSFGGTSQPQFGGFGSTSNIGNAFKSAFGGTPQPQFGGFGSTSSNGDFSESTPKAQSGFNFGARKDSTGSSQSSATPGSTYEPSHPDTNTAVAQDSNPSKIYEWIREEVKNCRGTELQGTLNPDVLPTLFHRQIAKWKGIATLHFQAVAKITARTLEQAVHTTCCDRATAENVQKLVQQRNRASEDRGLSQIHQRLNEIMTRHLQTQSPTFETNIQDARLARFRAALERYQSRTAFFSEANCPPALRDRITIDPHNVTALFNELHMSNAQNLEDDIHDTLKSYYELALHDFIEFVTQQVVESYLNDPKGPVLFFNPTYIGSLAPETLNNLGAENADVVRERAEKQAKLARLNRAEEIALNYSLAAGS